MRRTNRSMAGLVSATSLLLACAPDLDAIDGTRCKGGADCASGFECYRGFCVRIPDSASPILPDDELDAPTIVVTAPPDANVPLVSEVDADAPLTMIGDAGSMEPAQQVLTCSASESNCKPQCEEGMSCAITCGEVSNCEVTCASSCSVSCAQTDNCVLRCRAGATCQLDCREGDGNCEKIRCERGAACLLRCAGRKNCGFERCEGTPGTCPNGDLTCDHACP